MASLDRTAETPTCQDDSSFRLVQGLLDQLQSFEALAPVAAQLADIISRTPVHEFSKEDVHAHIARILFKKFTTSTVDPPVNLCTRLCCTLFLSNIKHQSGHTTRITHIHEYLFYLCIDSLSLDSCTGAIDAQGASGPTSRSDATPPTGDPVSGNMDNIPLAVDQISRLVAGLYNIGLISIGHVYEYLHHLTTSSAAIKVRLAGLHALFEAHSSEPDTGPWKTEIGSVRQWVMDAISRYTIAEYIRSQIETATNAPRTLEQHMNIPMLVDPVGEHGLSALLSPFASSEHAANGPLPSGAPKEYSSQTSTAAQGQADMLSARGTPSTFASTLAKAQRIGDLNAVSYPESVKAPNPVLDIAVMPGMFRYHRGFLLQFMNVCKERPHFLMPLALIEMLGLQPRPTDPNAPTPPNGARSGGRRGDQTGNGGAHSLQPQVAMRLGHGPGLTKVGLAAGNLQASSSRLGNSQSGFEAAADAHGGALFPGPPGSRWTHMTQSINHGEVSTGGPREAKRTRAQRGNNRGKGMQESGFQAASRQQVEGRPRSLEPLTDGRFVEDLNALPCFELMTPNPESDCAANLDRFRYNREVMLRFMNACKERPDWLPPLRAIKHELSETGTSSYQSRPRTGGHHIGSMGPGNVTLQRQESTGLGFAPGLDKGEVKTGNIQNPLSPLGGSQMASATRGRAIQSAIYGTGGGGPPKVKRTRSQRGKNREKRMAEDGSQALSNQQASASLEPVRPLEQSENRWVAGSTLLPQPQVEAHAFVERKVKALINKLTMANFDSISDQIVEWLKKTGLESRSPTFIQVIKFVFEGVKQEAAFSEMYARLCHKVMERISPDVHYKTTRAKNGEPIAGGALFRKHLLIWCQEEVKREWNDKDTAPEAVRQVLPRWGGPWALVGRGRQVLGLVWFIGELFKLGMLNERVVRECIKNLLSNTNPKEEGIESLCKLLTIVGRSIDKPGRKAGTRMDTLFESMREMVKGGNIDSRMQFMLLDVIELRARHWQTRPPLIQQQNKRNEDQRSERLGGINRGKRHDTTEPPGRSVAGGSMAYSTVREGGVPQFGKIPRPMFSKMDQEGETTLSCEGNANTLPALSWVSRAPPTE